MLLTAQVLIQGSNCPSLWTGFCKNDVLVKECLFFRTDDKL